MNQNVKFNAPHKENLSMQEYFSTLPAYIQESIKQSGVEFKSTDELMECAKNMMNK